MQRKQNKSINDVLMPFTIENRRRLNEICSRSFTAWFVRQTLAYERDLDDNTISLLRELLINGQFGYLKGIDYLLLNCAYVFAPEIERLRNKWIDKCSHINRFSNGSR
jgi:hypothetical protein